MPQRLGSKSLTLPVLSGSMKPYLLPGGQVVVERAPAAGCHLGDIMVFREADRMIAHRVLFRLKVGGHLRFYQKGDSSRSGYWVSDESVVGVVTRATDAEGRYLYLRNRHASAGRRLAYVQLLRDLMHRSKSVIKALVGYNGIRMRNRM